MTNDRVLIKGPSARALEVCSRRDQGIADEPPRHRTYANLDTRAVDTLFLYQVLTSVEGALCTGLGMFIRRGVADYHQLRTRLLLHGERDVVETALGFVVDSQRPTAIAIKADMAEILRLRNNRRGWNGQSDLRVCLSSLTKVINDVARDGDRGSSKSRGRELSRRSGCGNLARARCIGVRKRAILWACSRRADIDVGARRCT